MRMAEIPDRFKGKWPHERLGHKTWTAFVTSDPAGKIDGKTRTFTEPPGLGWKKQYESNLFKGRVCILELVERALPAATPEERSAKVDAVVDAVGPDTTQTIGWKVTGPSNFSPDAAAQAVEALAAGEVAADDIRERGPEALTKPRGRQTKSRIDQALRIVQRMTPQELYEFEAHFDMFLQSRKELGR